jgi:SAM-dependent methyltransferase
MALADEYRNQFRWRAWSTIFEALPPLDEKTVLDLGCGVGDQAAELVARGARVIAVDANAELLESGRRRGLRNVEFRREDLRALDGSGVRADGIWCSFAAAYFPALGELLRSWREFLVPGGWIALTEVDDLFGHAPVDAVTTRTLEAYREVSLAANRYDFQMGRKLHGHLEASGFRVTTSLELRDNELAFDGPADVEVLDAWATRLARMRLLQEFCGVNFGHVRDQLLAALADPRHCSQARVHCCVGIADASQNTSAV